MVDFGIAVNGEGVHSLAGSLAYMAPELLLGGAPSVASDLYAVGILAHQLIVGTLPFGAASMTELLSNRLGEHTDLTASLELAAFLENYQGRAPKFGALATPDKPVASVDPAVQAVLSRLLAHNPAERHSDALEVLRDLSASTGLSLIEETAATRESFLQAAALVGRSIELDVLTGALHEARLGKGSTWLIAGESGSGKSRLVDELRTLALVQEARVLRGQTVREGSGAYHVLREALEWLCLDVPLSEQVVATLSTIVPSLTERLHRSVPELQNQDARSLQERAINTILGLFETAAVNRLHPVVLILEDLQWVGRECLTLLGRLSDLSLRSSLLILGTFRDDEQPTLPAAVPDAKLLKLRRLDEASITLLTESMLGPAGRNAELIDFLIRESEGNPFFIVEIMRALAEHAGELGSVTQRKLPAQILTGGVRAVLKQRLRQAEPWAQPLLELAAVLGRQIEPRVLLHSQAATAMAGHSLDAWLRQLNDFCIIELRDTRWRFSHDKLRECMLEQLRAASRLQELHKQAASAIEKAYAGADRDAQLARLAYHYLEAAPLLPIDTGVQLALRAAERLMQQLGFAEAATLLERAVNAAQSAVLPELVQYELFLALGRAQILCGNTDPGKRMCERAAALARRLNSPELFSRAAVTHGSEFTPGRRDQSLIELLQEALQVLPPTDHPLRAWAMARLAAAVQPAPDPQEPVAMARTAIAMARSLGDPDLLRTVLLAACSAFSNFASAHECRQLDQELVELAVRAQDHLQAQRAHLRLVFDCLDLGDLVVADANIEAYAVLSQSFRQAQYQWPERLLRAMRALMTGQFSEAEELADEAQALAQRARDPNILFLTVHRWAQAWISEGRGDILSAAAQFQTLLQRIQPDYHFTYQSVQAISQVRSGQLDEARSMLREIRKSRELHGWLNYQYFLAEPCHVLKDTELARELYDCFVPHSGRFYVWGITGKFVAPPYSRALGLLDMTLERWDSAVHNLQDALRRSEAMGLRGWLARVRYELALALRGRRADGDTEKAHELQTQARELALQLGQTALLSVLDRHHRLRI